MEVTGAIGKVSIFALPTQDRPTLGGIGTAPRRAAFQSRPLNARSIYISGITKDSAGTAIGYCVVQLFRTVDDAIIAETVSDAAGAYSFVPGVTGPFYVVAYKATFRNAVLADGPRAYWRLGESSGLPQDIAGTNHVSSVAGSPTYGVAGGTGDGNTAMTFPAGSCLVVPRAPALDVGDSFTIEFLVKRSTVVSGLYGIFSGQHAGGDSPYVFIDGSGNPTLWSNGVGRVATCDTAILDTTAFHLGAVTKDGPACHWYLEGAQTPDDIASPYTYTNSTAPVAIGAETTSGTNSAEATLDEMLLYSYALSPARLAAHNAALSLASDLSGTTVNTLLPV